MRFGPSEMIKEGQTQIKRIISPAVVADFWEHPPSRDQIIDRLVTALEGQAFQCDYIMLGPIHLKADELVSHRAYTVILSVPMMRAVDWEKDTYFERVTQITLDRKAEQEDC